MPPGRTDVSAETAKRFKLGFGGTHQRAELQPDEAYGLYAADAGGRQRKREMLERQ